MTEKTLLPMENERIPLAILVGLLLAGITLNPWVMLMGTGINIIEIENYDKIALLAIYYSSLLIFTKFKSDKFFDISLLTAGIIIFNRGFQIFIYDGPEGSARLGIGWILSVFLLGAIFLKRRYETKISIRT